MIGDGSVSARDGSLVIDFVPDRDGSEDPCGEDYRNDLEKGERQATPLLSEVGNGDGRTLVESLSSNCNEELVCEVSQLNTRLTKLGVGVGNLHRGLCKQVTSPRLQMSRLITRDQIDMVTSR